MDNSLLGFGEDKSSSGISPKEKDNLARSNKKAKMLSTGVKSQEENATVGTPIDGDKELRMEESEESFVKETPMELGEDLDAILSQNEGTFEESSDEEDGDGTSDDSSNESNGEGDTDDEG
ncbi:hypothetical protein SESBI_04507 [Sesbania bispinosa]|nr:hypothetical protein SESBI_04507 [Sesbania bispinosa]